MLFGVVDVCYVGYLVEVVVFWFSVIIIYEMVGGFLVWWCVII